MKTVHTAEKGQAFAEFVISLTPIMFVFIGLLVVAIVGREQVRNIIEARAKVDSSSLSGVTLGGVQPDYLTGEFNTAGTAPCLPEGSFDTGKNVIDYVKFYNQNYKENLNVSEYRLDNLRESGITTFDYSSTNFLDAAALSGASRTDGDPLEKYGFPYLSNLARIYFNYSFSTEDKVFMPSRIE